MSTHPTPRGGDPAPAQIDFRTLYYTLRERAWLIVLCLVLASLATAAYLVRAPRVYAAKAVVQVEQEEQKILNVEGVQQERLQSLEALKTVEQTLQSRALLARILDSNNLARDPRFVKSPSPLKGDLSSNERSSPEAKAPRDPRFAKSPSPLNGERAGVRGEKAEGAPISKSEPPSPHPTLSPPAGGGEGTPSREELITQLNDMLDVRLRKGTRLIDIKVEHTDPALTELIANSLVREFMRQGFEYNSTASTMANDFLLTEAANLKRKLEESEQTLQTYREKTKSASLEDQQNVVVQKFKELGAKATEAKSQRIQNEAAYKQVQQAGNDASALLSIQAVANHPSVMELRSQIAKQESDLANLKQRYREKHPKYIQAHSQIAEWKSALQKAVLEVPQTIRSTYENAKANEEALDQALKDQEIAALELSKQSIKYNVLLRDVETDRAMYQSVLTRIKETSVTKELKPSNTRLVQAATIPEKPVRPQKLRVIAMGVFAGVGLGVLLVLLLNSLDRSIRTVDQAEEYLGLPVLSTIPKFSGLPETHRQLVAADEAHSAEAESFRTLRTALSMLGRKEDRRVFLFTSALPSEGKTFCSLNYALSLARQGLRTLVIDCDLRRPMVEKSIVGGSARKDEGRRMKDEVLPEGRARPLGAPSNPDSTDERRAQRSRPASSGAGMPRRVGLTDYLTGQKRFEEVVHPTEYENFSFIPAGTDAPNPAELLAQVGIGKLLEEALLHYDRVVIDSAPVHAVSDTLMIANQAQTVCLVVRSGKTPRNSILRAVQLMRDAEAPLSGVLLNMMPRRRGSGYGYYYYDSYYDYAYRGDYYGSKSGERSRATKKESARAA